MSLAEACYSVTRNFPKTETFGLTSQIRRAAVSVPANIAEGHGRENAQPFIQRLRIAQGSTKELETHLLLSARVGILANNQCDPLMETCNDIGKMLRSLIRSLQQRVGE
jgi:four helix bundle protein